MGGVEYVDRQMPARMRRILEEVFFEMNPNGSGVVEVERVKIHFSKRMFMASQAGAFIDSIEKRSDRLLTKTEWIEHFERIHESGLDAENMQKEIEGMLEGWPYTLGLNTDQSKPEPSGKVANEWSKRDNAVFNG